MNAGGGVASLNASTVVVMDSTFDHNAANNGAGVYVEVCGSSVFSGNTFTGNTAAHSGGGLSLVNCPGERACTHTHTSTDSLSALRAAGQARHRCVSCMCLCAD